MTEPEIHAKISKYQTSDAPIEVKQAAIERLEAMLVNDLNVVRQQIEDGQSDKDSADHLS